LRLEWCADADWLPSAREFVAGAENEALREEHDPDTAEGKAVLRRLEVSLADGEMGEEVA